MLIRRRHERIAAWGRNSCTLPRPRRHSWGGSSSTGRVRGKLVLHLPDCSPGSFSSGRGVNDDVVKVAAVILPTKNEQQEHKAYTSSSAIHFCSFTTYPPLNHNPPNPRWEVCIHSYLLFFLLTDDIDFFSQTVSNYATCCWLCLTNIRSKSENSDDWCAFNEALGDGLLWVNSSVGSYWKYDIDVVDGGIGVSGGGGWCMLR